MKRFVKALFYSNNKLDGLQVFYFLATVAFLVLVLAVGYFLLLDDNPPMVVNSIEVLTRVVKPGEEFRILVDFCTTSSAKGTAYITWLDGIVTFQVPHPLRSPEGCYRTVFSSPVPNNLEPGLYNRLTEMVYDVNALTERTVTYELPGIIVLPADEGE